MNVSGQQRLIGPTSILFGNYRVWVTRESECTSLSALSLISRTEAWDSHKFQVLGLSYNWWGLQAWDTLQDSTDNSCTNKTETSLEWQEYFSQFQDTTDALPCRIHLPVCLWIIIMDTHNRAPKQNTSHGNEVLLQDTTHLIQRPSCQPGSRRQDPVGNQTTRRPPDHLKEMQTAVVWTAVHQVCPKPSCKAQWKGEEGKADRGRGRKRTSGNGQAWSLSSPRGQWRTGENGGKWLQNHLWCPNNPHG